MSAGSLYRFSQTQKTNRTFVFAFQRRIKVFVISFRWRGITSWKCTHCTLFKRCFSKKRWLFLTTKRKSHSTWFLMSWRLEGAFIFDESIYDVWYISNHLLIRDSPLSHKSFRYLVPVGGEGGGTDEVCIVCSTESYKYELSAVYIIPEYTFTFHNVSLRLLRSEWWS